MRNVADRAIYSKSFRMEHSPNRLFGLAYGVASGACYGCMVFLIHAAGNTIPASEITFLRAICAFVLLLPSAAGHGFDWFRRGSVLLWARSAIGAISVSCLVWNLQHTSVGFANTLFNLAPIIVVVLGTLTRQERLTMGRFFNVILVVVASTIFWHGSRFEIGVAVWVVGLSGMCAASVAYAMLKVLPSKWTALDVTWCLNLATMPVALAFKQQQWIVPHGRTAETLAAICASSVVGNALANLSFRHLELSTATALIPSAIIWGVLLEMMAGSFPAAQGIVGCVLYIGATALLAFRTPFNTQRVRDYGADVGISMPS